MFTLPSSLAPTEDRAREIADQARDFILNHSATLREKNDASLPGLVSRAEAVEGGYKASFYMKGDYKDLAAADVPMPSIVTGRGDIVPQR